MPGAAVALTDGTTVIEAVHGVKNLRTGDPVTPRTLFQIGSITKVYTATLVMALVDEGLIELDAPVQRYLPWFKVADAEVSKHVTPRHLLCHTAGFVGQDFPDLGRGDEALRLYVEGLAAASQVHPLGGMFSYTGNSGFATLGMIVEALTGRSWDVLVQDVIARPLGLTLGTLPEQVIMHPHAVGHLELPLQAEGQALQVASHWSPPRSVGPAGTICSSAADLLAFGRMHVDGGAKVLSTRSVLAMQEEQVLLEDAGSLGRAWGLGWILPTPGVIGHDGVTFGQLASYRLHPDSGAAMACFTNGPGSRAIFERLFAEFLSPLAGVSLPVTETPPDAPDPVTTPERYVGDYQRHELRIQVRAAGDRLEVTLQPLGPNASQGVVATPTACVRLHGDTFVSTEVARASGVHTTIRFVVPDGTGRAEWAHLGARAMPRIH